MADYFESGFCVRQASWHRKETLVQEYPESWDDARLLAGLLWEPAEAPAYRKMLIKAADDLPASAVITETFANGDRMAFVALDNFKIIERDDTRAVLDVAHVDRGLISHASMGDLLDAYTEGWRKAGAGVRFETAGSVRDGRQVYALVRLDEPYQIPGDESLTYPFAAMLNSHDGSTACRLLPTQVRVVCWNTFQMALNGAREGVGITLRHSKHVNERLADAKGALSAMREDAKAWQMLATDLAGINIDDAVVRTFLNEFIPIPENATERTRESRNERQGIFLKLYNESPTIDGVRGTAYGLVQAAGEYLDHVRPFKNADTYLARTMLTVDPIKQSTIGLIREMAVAA